MLARFVWVAITLLSLGLFVASLPSFFAYLHRITNAISTASLYGQQLTPVAYGYSSGSGLSIDFYAWLYISVLVLLLLVYVLVGLIIIWRKSDDRLALLASLTLVQFPVALSSAVAMLPPALTWLTEGVTFFGNACLALFICLFPGGQFVPRWTRWLAVAWIVCNLNTFFPGPPLNNSLVILINIPFWFFLAVCSLCRSTAIVMFQHLCSANRPSGWSLVSRLWLEGSWSGSC